MVPKVLPNLLAISLSACLIMNSYFGCRVLEIMQRDAQKDPTSNPSAARARLLVDQVDFLL